MEKLDAGGRVHEIFDRDERIATIAHEYKRQPEGTLVVSPDNQSRVAINEAIHYAMQDTNRIPYLEYRSSSLRTLRRRLSVFVRALRRYYTTVRLSTNVHVGIVVHHLLQPARSSLPVGR
jgi:hypothetical protein